MLEKGAMHGVDANEKQSKLNLGGESNPLDDSSKSKLKLGLFSYPVLQAADILVHGWVYPILSFHFMNGADENRATHVPVGEDQSQHLEFARECVTNFNANYGEVLVRPRTILCEHFSSLSCLFLSLRCQNSVSFYFYGW